MKHILYYVFCLMSFVCLGQQNYNARSVFFAGTDGTMWKDTATYCMTSPCPIGTVIFGTGLNMYVRQQFGWKLFNGGGVVNANNGLSVSGSTVQLGGPLIQNTNITGANDLTASINFFSLTTSNDIRLFSGTGIKLSPLLAGNALTSPLTFQSGSLTSPVLNGGFGYNGSHLYFGIGGTHYQLDRQNIPAGSDTQIQYNNSGAFGASSNLTYTNSVFTLGGTAGTVTLNAGGSSASENIQFTDTNNTVQLTVAGLSLVGTQATTGFNIVSESATGNTGKLVYLTDISHTFNSRLSNTVVVILRIPTSAAGLPSGAIWSNAGVLNIVP